MKRRFLFLLAFLHAACLVHATAATTTLFRDRHVHNHGHGHGHGYGLRGNGGGEERRGGNPITIPLTNWMRGNTDLQWYGQISVGTPPQIL